jgi:hypothetical protein
MTNSEDAQMEIVNAVKKIVECAEKVTLLKATRALEGDKLVAYDLMFLLGIFCRDQEMIKRILIDSTLDF